MYVSENDKKTFRSLLLLDLIIKNALTFDQTIRNGLLQPVFDLLIMSGSIAQDEKGNYIATPKGVESYASFMKRFDEYKKMYDVFSYVDTGKGEFGYATFFTTENVEDWKKYVSDLRFEDMRVAVSLFKKINPAEIIFMSFLNEGRFEFNFSNLTWPNVILSESQFTLIDEIISAAIKPGGVITDAFMEDMLKQGTELTISLLKQESEQISSVPEEEFINASGITTTTVTTIEESSSEEIYDDYDYDYYIDYYESYYDPYYVSPFWYDPLFIW